MNLDFTKCKTKEDVEKIFEQNKDLIGLINKESIIKGLSKGNKTIKDYNNE